jgi:peptide methionine sulfoxide reductase MsrA
MPGRLSWVEICTSENYVQICTAKLHNFSFILPPAHYCSINGNSMRQESFTAVKMWWSPTFRRNAGNHQQDYTASHPRRPQWQFHSRECVQQNTTTWSNLSKGFPSATNEHQCYIAKNVFSSLCSPNCTLHSSIYCLTSRKPLTHARYEHTHKVCTIQINTLSNFLHHTENHKYRAMNPDREFVTKQLRRFTQPWLGSGTTLTTAD